MVFSCRLRSFCVGIAMEIKVELIRLGKRQVDVVKELNKRGLPVQACDVSLALSGLPRPKYDAIRTETEKLIEEWKANEAK